MLLKKSRLFNIFICIVTVLAVVSLMMPVSKTSAEGENKSLTLVCVSDDVVLAGMQWKLYRVGERRNTAQNFIQTGDFAAFQVNLRNLSVERVTEAAQSFQAYAVANQIPPLREGTTDQNGEVEFSGLDAGLYLLSGKILKVDSYYYVPTTALVEIREDDENLRYDAYPKFSYRVMNQTPKSYTVIKRWLNDEDRINERPSSIIVDLYKDEELYDSVVLSDSNDWKYRWIDDEGASTWIVMERDVPDNYTMRVVYDVNDESHYLIENSYFENSGTTTDITTTTTTTMPVASGEAHVSNTTTTKASGLVMEGTAINTTLASGTLAEGSATQTGTTTAFSGPVGDGSATRTNTESSPQSNGNLTTAPSNNNSSSSGGKLPQTGQLWWPIIPLSIGGVILIAAGLTIRTRKKSDE